MRKRVFFLVFALALSGLIVFTSLNTGSTYEGIGGVIGKWMNATFFGGSLIEEEVSAVVGFGSKFLGHFWLFAFTGLFWFLFLRTLRWRKRSLVLLLVLGICLASLGEIIQIFTRGRYPSFADVLLNYSGFMLLPTARLLFVRFNGGVFPREDVVEEHA